MFDVDFLSEPQFRTHVLHLYDQGVFAPEVRRAVASAAESRGWVWADQDPASPDLVVPGLFDHMLVAIDLDQLLNQPHAATILSAVASSLSADKSVHYFCYGSGVGPLSSSEAWDTLMDKALVLHEPHLSTSTSLKVLKAVAGRLLVAVDTVENRSELDASVRDWVGRSAPSLPQFLSMLEVGLVASVRGSRFDPTAFRDAVHVVDDVEPALWVGLIANFIRQRTDLERRALLAALDAALLSPTSPVLLVNALRRATFDLAKVNEALNKGQGTVPAGWPTARWEAYRAYKTLKITGLLRWQMLLAQHEMPLLTGGLPAWDLFLRQVQSVGRT